MFIIAQLTITDANNKFKRIIKNKYNMKTSVFLGIGFRIVILFTVGMFMTYVPEHLTEFFGDKIVTKSYGDVLEWGTRHYWYNTMMILLFILALVNVVFSIIRLVNKNYDTTKW